MECEDSVNKISGEPTVIMRSASGKRIVRKLWAQNGSNGELSTYNGWCRRRSRAYRMNSVCLPLEWISCVIPKEGNTTHNAFCSEPEWLA